jgi:hypothetical protein
VLKLQWLCFYKATLSGMWACTLVIQMRSNMPLPELCLGLLRRMCPGWPTLAARAVALGYNVMAIDADTVAIGDFYLRIKSPPMDAFTMISQYEGGHGINGGFSYIQNARRNGPTTYLLFSAVYRTAR